MTKQVFKINNTRRVGLLILLMLMTHGIIYSQTYSQIISIAPTGVTSSTWDIRTNTSIQSNTALIDQNDDKFYPIVTATSFLNNLGYWNCPAFGYIRPTFSSQNNNYNGDVVVQNSGDGLATVRWKFKPDGSFVVPGNINLNGQIFSKAPVGVASSIWNIGNNASVQGSTVYLDQNDDTFYPIITASSFINGKGFWNFPAFGFTRPTFSSQNNNYNGDVVIQNSGDGLSAVRWKFKPNGDFIAVGNINAQGANFNGNVLIGKASQVNTTYKLDVNGTIRANEIQVNLDGADFVFENDYKLMSIKELEKFVKEQKHLPEIAPAKEMVQDGTNLGNLNSKLLQKIEELTLYTIEQNKAIEEFKQALKLQNEEIEKLKAALK